MANKKEPCDNCIVLLTNDYNPTLYTVRELPTLSIKHTDGRLGYARKFNYCPECGTKIDWKILRALHKEARKGVEEYNFEDRLKKLYKENNQ